MKNFLFIFLAIITIAFSAQFTIDIEGIAPITGQTLTVLLTGYFLGRKMGTLAVTAYVVLGLLGLPLFAEGKAGWAVLSGGSGGYLIGFIAGAYVCGTLKLKNWDRNFIWSLLLMTIGTAIILIFGVGRLVYLYGWDKGLAYGFYPFWEGAVIKIIIGALFIFISQQTSNRIS